MIGKKKFRKFSLIAILALGIIWLFFWQFGRTNLWEFSGTNETAQINDGQKISNLEELVGERRTNSGLEMVGAITIPDLKINLPIFRGAGDKELDHGAGIVGENGFGSENFSLAAHQVFGSRGANGWFFGPLVSAQKGQIVLVADEQNVYEYHIADSFIVDVSDVEILETVPNRKILTLIYCTDAASDRRTIVRADFVSQKAISELNSQKIKHFNALWNVSSK